MRDARRWLGWFATLTLGLGLLAACGRDNPPTATAPVTISPAPSAPTATPAASPNASPTVGFDTSQAPPAPAPHGLGQLTLPNTPDAIQALLARMPDKLAGKSRVKNQRPPAPDAFQVTYGDPKQPGSLALTIVPVTVQDYLAPFGSGGGYVAYTLTLPGADGGPREGGRDGTLLWERSTNVSPAGGAPQPGQPTAPPSAGDATTYTMLWGADGGGYVFGAVAGSPADLDDLIGAFSQAAGPPA